MINDQFKVLEVTSDVHAKSYQHRKTRSRRIANAHNFLILAVRNGGVTEKIVRQSRDFLRFRYRQFLA